MIRCFFALLLLLISVGANGAGGEAIPAAYREAAARHSVPARALYLFALSRTGVALSSGTTRPWPWTLSVDGKTTRYKNKQKADKSLRALLAKGARSDLRVGLLHLSWSRHAEAFGKADAAFDPQVALNIGAKRLGECRKATSDWDMALARCAVPTGKPPYKVNWAGVRRYAEAIRQAAAPHRLDPALVAAVIAAESNFKPGARSSANAQGLMQLIPATAARFGVRDPRDPAQNLRGGTKYLRWLLDTFDGDLALALAGYNAGEKAVMKYDRQIPPYAETRAYVPKVLNFYELLRSEGVVRGEGAVGSDEGVARNGEVG